MSFRAYLRVGFRALAVAACLSLASYASQASAGTIYAIDDQNNLFTFDNLTPQNLSSGVFLSGLKPNEHLINIDFRPFSGALYGIGSSFQVYEVNPATGACLAVGNGFGPVQGNSFGMDFNPLADRIRFFSDNENNMRVNQLTGAAVLPLDTDLAYAAGDPNFGVNPNVIGAGYTGSILGPNLPTTTTLYGIDSNTNTLVRVGSVGGAPNSPNGGALTTIGALGVDANNSVGFDISSNDLAFAALSTGGNSRLYSVNLATGSATDFGQIIGGVRVVDIALQPGVVFNLPEPSTIVMVVLGGLGMCAIRRRKAAK